MIRPGRHQGMASLGDRRLKLPDQEILRLLPSRVREHAWLGASLLILGLSYAAIRMEPASFPIILTAQILLFLTVIHIVAFGADMLVNAASRIAEKLGRERFAFHVAVADQHAGVGIDD